jgi:hypothetical protein
VRLHGVCGQPAEPQQPQITHVLVAQTTSSSELVPATHSQRTTACMACGMACAQDGCRRTTTRRHHDTAAPTTCARQAAAPVQPH